MRRRVKGRRRRRLTSWLRLVEAALLRVRWPVFFFCFFLSLGTLAFWLGHAQPSTAHSFIYSLDLVTLTSSPSDMPDQFWLQCVAYLVMFGGILSVAAGATRVFTLIRDPREQQLAMASTFHDHVIVCGIGKVGWGVLRQLQEFGEPVVAVNKTEGEWGEDLQKAGVPLLIADARKRETLVEAGIERAAALVACTSDDLTNLDIALDAREANPRAKVIMRMFDEGLAAKVARSSGIHTALSVPALAAPAFAVAATRAGIDHAFTLHGQLLSISPVTFRPGSPFLGKTLQAVEEQVNCTFIGIVREGTLHLHPDHQHLLKAGDQFSVLGSLEAIKWLEG